MNNKNHWIIRISDGINFKNSKYLFWGVKRGKNDCLKSIVKKFKEGDILWFITNKKNGGKIIGMAEYVNFFDKKDEPLISINSISNEEQNWTEGEYDIQIHYKNLYNTEKQNIRGCFVGMSCIFYYDRIKDKIDKNLYNEYDNYIYYCDPVK